MHKHGIGYGSINHPVDGCLVCKHQGIIENECPKCGNKDENNIERIRRITGYFMGELNKQMEYGKASRRENVSE